MSDHIAKQIADKLYGTEAPATTRADVEQLFAQELRYPDGCPCAPDTCHMCLQGDAIRSLLALVDTQAATIRTLTEERERLREQVENLIDYGGALTHIPPVAAEAPAPPAETCQHGHTKKTSGCVSCELLYRRSAPAPTQADRLREVVKLWRNSADILQRAAQRYPDGTSERKGLSWGATTFKYCAGQIEAVLAALAPRASEDPR